METGSSWRAGVQLFRTAPWPGTLRKREAALARRESEFDISHGGQNKGDNMEPQERKLTFKTL